ETFLWGRRPIPWTVQAGGRDWAVVLRRKAHSMPFALRLEKFTKDDHPGMAMARSFSSDVTKIFPDGTEEAVHIRMNEPLRDGGLVVYQASYGPPEGQPGEPYSVLAVSRNPSDRMPWIAVSVIAIGLAMAMFDRLFEFIKRERTKRDRAVVSGKGAARVVDAAREEAVA
ncbi:MAG: cytochrome c biogenesis protein ResB, partial [Planctomycetota bacterium]|nr:cytochrome c biogenesis protein ResB [Planctomycetota bacterium]